MRVRNLILALVIISCAVLLFISVDSKPSESTVLMNHMKHSFKISHLDEVRGKMVEIKNFSVEKYVELLKELKDQQDTQIKYNVIYAGMCKKDVVIQNELISLYKSEKAENVKKVILLALGEYETEETLKLFEEALTSDNQVLSQAALSSLAKLNRESKIPNNRAINILKESEAKIKSEEIRNDIKHILGEVGNEE